MRGWWLAGLLAVLATAPARARDTLVIGVSQFPASLHPYIDPAVVTSYAEGFTMRPITAFDADWKNGCLMCTELPTLANGRVTFEDLGGGKRGMAVKVTLRDGLKWGDGAPVTTADLAFTAHVGRDPNSGFADTRTWGRISNVRGARPAERGAALRRDERAVRPHPGRAARAHRREGRRRASRAGRVRPQLHLQHGADPRPDCSTGRS